MGDSTPSKVLETVPKLAPASSPTPSEPFRCTQLLVFIRVWAVGDAGRGILRLKTKLRHSPP